jgi:uncharacterized protein DUF4440
MSDDAAWLSELEHRVRAAVFGRDQAGMATLMHPDGYGFDAPMGLVSQRELIDGISALEPDARFAIDDVRTVSAGPTVAALTYRLRQWGRFRGTPLPDVVHCTSVWRLSGTRWQAVFHHETPDRTAG